MISLTLFPSAGSVVVAFSCESVAPGSGDPDAFVVDSGPVGASTRSRSSHQSISVQFGTPELVNLSHCQLGFFKSQVRSVSIVSSLEEKAYHGLLPRGTKNQTFGWHLVSFIMVL